MRSSFCRRGASRATFGSPASALFLALVACGAIAGAEPPPAAAPVPLVAPETPAASPPSLVPQGAGPHPLAYPLVAVGLAGLATGAVLAFRTKELNDDAVEHCPTDRTCDATGLERTDDARRAARAGNVAFAIGGAALAGGVGLVLVTPRPAGVSVRVGPSIGPASAAWTVAGRW